ncbi:hypothetical protein GP486_006635 [Trichoglossum hirsutum]|uniref:Uncharacterized protein n=1 Tax=Trichoglossum hirsutum TaxID=265104 RepID=A0A9P8L7S1_9PEZI|nr:hypothetical protein GP486_006635 [Trichoglossum hirsutum]
MGWTGVHNQINDLAPFSQLASPNGAPASALFGNGLSTWYSWLGLGAVWVMTPLASEVIYFDTDYCTNPDLDSPNPCWPPRMSVNTDITRTLQVLLSISAAVVATTAIMWFHKPCGISGDPTSIAAIAAIMGHPDVAADFRTLDPEIKIEELKKLLKDKKYKLGYYRLSDGTERYGIIPASEGDGEEQEGRPVPRGIDSGLPISQSRWKPSFINGWRDSVLLIDGLFFFFLVGILGTTAAYFKTVGNSNLAKVFESKSVARRVVFALLGSLAAFNWGRLGRGELLHTPQGRRYTLGGQLLMHFPLSAESQTLAPYMRLDQSDADPTSTILLRKRTLPITAFFPMLVNRHFPAAAIAFTSLLSEFLVVTLAGMPYRPGQLRGEFYFCGITSLAILVIMLTSLVLFNVWRRFLPHLPRKPDSVAAVMTYVCDSRMNADFEGLEHDSVSKRDKTIKKLGKRYKYGLRRRPGGGAGWVVDETGETHVRKVSEESSTSSQISHGLQGHGTV